MKNKYFFLFSLIFILIFSLSASSAVSSDISQDNLNIGENENSFIDLNSYSSLKNSNLPINIEDGDSSSNSQGLETLQLNEKSEDGSLDNLSVSKSHGVFNDLSTAYEESGFNDLSTNNRDSNDLITAYKYLGLDDEESDDLLNESAEILNESTEILNESAEILNESDYLFLISPDNLNIFFDDSNTLKSEYAGCTLVFEGNFTDLGVLKISGDSTLITARDNLFKNTVFSILSDNVSLTNLNFDLDEVFDENNNAGIFLLSDNLIIYNITMNCTVPKNTRGFCIYGEGLNEDRISGLSIINSTFNYAYPGLNDSFDYGIYLNYLDDVIISGNRIESVLPLESVDSNSNYAGFDSYSVGTLALNHINNLSLSSNYIHTSVNGSGYVSPSLETILINGSEGILIEENTILAEDFYTAKGKENHIEAIHIFFCDDSTIISNEIGVKTSGGRSGVGSAYPIYISGPADNMKIAFNNISTESSGPNIGIHSQNYFGNTHIDIISNFINVTGLASTHSWAILSGIEVQDDNDIIMNNTIIVNNIGNFNINNNIYGISYTQNMNGNHTYDIQYNNITTNGYYAIKLSGADSLLTDSVVANNVLNSKSLSGNSAVTIGAGKNNTILNNTGDDLKNKMDDDEKPKWLKDYSSQAKPSSNTFQWIANTVNAASNGTGFSDNIADGSGLIDNGGNSSNGNGTGDGDSLISGDGDSAVNSNSSQGGNEFTDSNSSSSSDGNGTGEIELPIDPSNTNPVPDNNATEAVNSTIANPDEDFAQVTNQTNSVENNTELVNTTENQNQDSDEDSNDLNLDNEDSDSNPGESPDELDSDSSSEPDSSSSDSTVSSKASSPGLSGAAASKKAYELDKDKDIIVDKSVDNIALAGICLIFVLLLIIGYKRQKDRDEEE